MSVFESFFSAESIVLIGASRMPGRLGHTLARNLATRGFPGTVHFVNPKGGELFGRPIHSSLEELPGGVDLAVVLVPPQLTPATIAACGQRGIRRAIVATGGFGELGEQGRELEAKLLEAAKAHDVRLVGPNCIGLIDAHRPLDTTFLSSEPVPPGALGLISQSGALCAVLIDQMRESGPGFSRLASLGNSIDLTVVDALDAYSGHAPTRATLLYLESIRDGQSLVESARRSGKPVVALKVGRSKAAQRAAQSHTGALAGDDRLVEAAFRRAGIIRAGSIRQLVQFGAVAAMANRLRGDRLAVFTNAGGPGVAATDAISAAGLHMADLADETVTALKEVLPSAASFLNPVDGLASAGPTEFGVGVRALSADPGVDGILVIAPRPPGFDPDDVARSVVEAASITEKPVVAVLMADRSVDAARAILRRAGIPVFDYPEDAVRALAATRVRALPEQPPTPRSAGIPKERPEGWMTYGDALRLAGDSGIPVELPRFAQTPGEAAAQAGDDTVVLKAEATSALHKTEVGGVVLGLRGADAVQAAAIDMASRIPDLNGIWLEPMAGPGIDLIIGAARDPQFGPFVMAGGGGTGVEEDRDIAFELAPLTLEQARGLLLRTRAGRSLEAGRGRPASDLEAAARSVYALAQRIAGTPRIAEIEINPLRVFSSGVRALDARARLH